MWNQSSNQALSPDEQSLMRVDAWLAMWGRPSHMIITYITPEAALRGFNDLNQAFKLRDFGTFLRLIGSPKSVP